MKKFFLASILVASTMVCSCQKHDSAAQQLAKQKAEVDAREKALDERLNALEESLKSLNGKGQTITETQKETANSRNVPLPAAEIRTHIPKPDQTQPDEQRRIEPLSTTDPDLAQAMAEKVQQETEMQSGQKPSAPAELQSPEQLNPEN